MTVAYFSKPISHPLDVVDQLHGGRPPIATPGQALLIYSPGRTGYGFARMAARAPGNQDAMIMVVPYDVKEWYRVSVLNHNAKYLDDGIVFNPSHEKYVHILPPRGVEGKLKELVKNASSDEDFAAIAWAREQLAGEKGEKLRRVTAYWMAATQVQVITTRVEQMPLLVDREFVQTLQPNVRYAFLHPSKSISRLRLVNGRPVFGHGLLQELLKEQGRADLAPCVVASGGYWVDTTVWLQQMIRLLFTSENPDAVSWVATAIGGTAGHYDRLAIKTQVGAAAVFMNQFGGSAKNWMANMLGEMVATRAISVVDRERNLSTLQSETGRKRERMIRELRGLANRVMQRDGLLEKGEEREIPAEVLTDMNTCTNLDWAALMQEAEDLDLPRLKQLVGKRMDEETVRRVRRGLVTFFNAAPEALFGTTNMTYGIIYGLCHSLEEAGLVASFRDVLDMEVIRTPEGVAAMPSLREMFGHAEFPDLFAKAMKRFSPLLA